MSAQVGVGSPCMKVCMLDTDGQTCVGCLRTVDEIARWGSLTNGEREEVIGLLPERHRRRTGQPAALRPQRCPGCGTEFGCGANGPQDACWCMRYPPVEPRAGVSCLCPACLAAAAT